MGGSGLAEGLPPLSLPERGTQRESLGPSPAAGAGESGPCTPTLLALCRGRGLGGSGPVKGCPLPLEPNNCLLLCCVVSGARGLSFVGTCCGESLPA